MRSRTPGLVGIWYYSCDLHGLAPGASIEWVVGVALAETGQPADLSAMPLSAGVTARSDESISLADSQPDNNSTWYRAIT